MSSSSSDQEEPKSARSSNTDTIDPRLPGHLRGNFRGWGETSFQPNPISRTISAIEGSSTSSRHSRTLSEDVFEKKFQAFSADHEAIVYLAPDNPRAPRLEDFDPRIPMKIILDEDDKRPPKHVIILLHEAANREDSLKPLARKLAKQGLRTVFILLRGTKPSPKGFQWKESSGAEADTSFLDASNSILTRVIKDVLISKCSFKPIDIMLLGHGEGGAAALATAVMWAGVELAGVVSIEGPLPAYARSESKAKTPALVLYAERGRMNSEALQRIRDRFIIVDVEIGKVAVDGLSGTENLTALMKFFAHRLEHEEWTKQTILSFDGGGIRGLGSLIILQELMNKIGEEEKRLSSNTQTSFDPCIYRPTLRKQINHSDRNPEGLSEPDATMASVSEHLPCSARYLPCHYFTYCTGTSTGGLISIMLSRFRMTVDDCIEEYKALGERIFGHPRLLATGGVFWHKFSAPVLENVIKDVTSRHREAHDFTANYPSPEDLCRTLVFAYADHEKSDVPYYLRTYSTSEPSQQGEPKRNYGDPLGVPIWQIARATSAAPGIFRPITIPTADGQSFVRFKDGGFGTNNPTREAFGDIKHKHGGQTKNIELVISIGTGETSVSRFPKKKGNIQNAWANLKAATKLPSRTNQAHETMNALANLDGKKQFSYFRFTGGKDLGDVALDEWETHRLTGLTGRENQSGAKTIKKISLAMAHYLRQPSVQRDLAACAKILVARRQLMIRDESRWERYASASYYVCTLQGCQKAKITTRQEYEQHIKSEHSAKLIDQSIESTMHQARRCWIYQNLPVPGALPPRENVT